MLNGTYIPWNWSRTLSLKRLIVCGHFSISLTGPKLYFFINQFKCSYINQSMIPFLLLFNPYYSSLHLSCYKKISRRYFLAAQRPSALTKMYACDNDDTWPIKGSDSTLGLSPARLYCSRENPDTAPIKNQF